MNGSVYSSAVVTATTGVGSDLLSFTIDYSSDVPSSLSFRFNDGFADAGRSVSLESVRVNGTLIDNSSDLTATMLNYNQAAALNVSNTDYMFGRSEPIVSDVGTADITGTGSADHLASNNDGQIVDGGAGNDRILAYDGDDAVFGGTGDDTMFGGDGNDILVGQAGNDFLLGNAGDDILYGGADNDILLGGDGNDVLNGGTGDDAILGDAGDDIMYGDSGNDIMLGDSGDDIIYGDGGDDTIMGGAGNDTIYGGDNDDSIIGGDGNDTIDGGTGADSIEGGAGDDIITGSTGDDLINSGTGNDTVDGGDDNDRIWGEAGNDTIDGGNGNDSLYGGTGADILNGGGGADILHGNGIDKATIASLLHADSTLSYSAETGSFYRYVSGTVDIATAQAAATAATLNGVAGHLVTITSADEQTFVHNLISADIWLSASDSQTEGQWVWNGGAEDGVNFYNGAVGGTTVAPFYTNWNGGEPNDYNTGEDYAELRNSDGLWNDYGPPQGSQTLGYVIEWDSGMMAEDNAADTLNGGAGNDFLYGYGGNDTLNGDAGADLLLGGTGNDIMDGGSGDDQLYGGLGNDTINGGDNNDTLYASGIPSVTTSGASNVTLYSDGFDTDTRGNYTYSENDGANVDVTNSYDSTDGNTANGSAEIYIDGWNNSSYNNASGTFTYSYTATDDATNVTLDFSYRHYHSNRNDNGEDSYVYFSMNGTNYDQSGGNSYIDAAYGSGGTTDTGWQTVTINLPDMTAGSTYDLSFTLYQNRASRKNEDSWMRLDDIALHGDTSVTTATVGDAGSVNVLHGDAGNDVLYGSAGADTLYGDAGNDGLHSNSSDTLDSTIASILASNSGVTYSAETNSFYQLISATVDWTVADAAASSSTLTGLSGVNGHLATITSAAEQTYLEGLTGGTSTWIGGGDYSSEGVWRWTSGPESGAQFADASGNSVNGWYNSWTGGQPNDSNSTQNYLYMLNGTSWADLVNQGDGSTGYVNVDQYMIEWEASSLLSTVDRTTLDGGTGADTLYGSDGLDVFNFNSTDAMDTIQNFSTTGHDQLDISNILTGYNYTSDNINDFVQLSESGGNTTLSVDSNGAAGGANFVAVAQIDGVTGLDLHEMIAADNLVV